MKLGTICTLALGCATMMGTTMMQAQTSGAMCGSGGAKSGMAMGSDQDKQFLMQASQSDYNEIQLSNLAVQKSTNPKVKQYAQKMITDHQQLEQQMQPFAQQMGVTPASSLDAQHQQLRDQLSQLSGADFDKQYMSDMDTDHHATLQAFQTELTSTQDKAMKPTLKKGEKVVAEHTKMADKMTKQMGGTASGM